jgi:hypothetical protein
MKVIKKSSSTSKYNHVKQANAVIHKAIRKTPLLIAQVNLYTDEKLSPDFFEEKKPVIRMNERRFATQNQHGMIYNKNVTAEAPLKRIHIFSKTDKPSPASMRKLKVIFATPIKREAAEVMSSLDSPVLFSDERASSPSTTQG